MGITVLLLMQKFLQYLILSWRTITLLYAFLMRNGHFTDISYEDNT
jgi:hypothetical protein